MSTRETITSASQERAPHFLESIHRKLLDEEATESCPFFDERPVRLVALDDLHFLDQHACLLLARARHTPVLVLREGAPEHLCVRVRANVICAGETAEGARLYDYYAPSRGESLDYTPGVLLNRFTDVHRYPALWHNYLTSRDRTLTRLPAGATLEGKFPHLRAGFVTGIDLFNCGEFYRAHEDWESLWMRLEEGAERSLAQGLIQLAGAHIHRLKNRPHESRKLLAGARHHIGQGRTIEWLDADKLLAASEIVFAAPGTGTIELPCIPLHDARTGVARKHR